MANATENFEQLVRHRPLPELIDFLVQLDKQDLVAVRGKTKALYKEMNDWRNDTPASRALMQREAHLLMAGLATYTKQEALGRSFELPAHLGLDNDKDNRGYKEHFMRVLRHSRPSWFRDWLVRQARTEFGYILPYSQLREMETAGLLGHDSWLFAQSLAQHPSYYNRTNKERGQGLATFMLAQLQADTTLLARDLPLLFDYDTNVDSASAYLGAKLKSVSWLTLLPALTESGHLDRATLLTSSLLALRRDFRRPLLSWFKDLFLALEPTPDERVARQAELLELLAQPLTQVVNFALDQLKLIWGEPGFAVDALLPYADELLTRPDLKTGLKTLFAGFDKLLKVRPGLTPALAPRYAAALAHPDAGVQERAAKGLAALLGAKKPLLAAAAAAETVAAIEELRELLGTAARTLLAPWLAAAPAPAAETASYAPRTGFVPDISAATAIAPVADWHELLFLTGQVLRENEPAAFERWLDGLLRLRGQYPANYTAQLGPYLQQAFPWQLEDQLETGREFILPDYPQEPKLSTHYELVRYLLASWSADFAQPQLAKIDLDEHPQNRYDPLMLLEYQRLAVAEARLHPAQPQPQLLLSTPTHAPSWVAPTALVDKLIACEVAGQQPDPTDLVLALARTAFAAEADAVVARQRLPRLAHTGLRALLTWFLAPTTNLVAVPLPAPAAPAHGSTGPLAEALPWLWAVAARTRHPTAELPELCSLADYPGVTTPWQPAWFFEPKSYTHQQSWNKLQPEVTTTWVELTVTTEHPGQQPPALLALYSLHARLPQDNRQYLWLLEGSLPFLLTLMPSYPDPLHWHVLRTACRTAGTGSEARRAMEYVLAPLLGAGPRFAEGTTALLAVGLTYTAPSCRALAREVVLAAVTQRRLMPARLGEALGRLLAATYAPIPRLADGLATLTGIDPLTDDALTQVLEALLPELPAAPPRNTRKLLETYALLQPRTARPVPAAVQARLGEWRAVASLKPLVNSIMP